MHSPLDTFAAIAAALLGTAIVLSIRPIPEIAFVLQCSGVGGLVGAGWSVTRTRRREPGAIGFAIATGSLVGAWLGLLIWGIEALLF